jgi:iron-sulfur cluster assembly protein
MALDEPKDDDEVTVNNGITYMINKQLLDEVKPVSVEFMESPHGSGFAINSNLKKAGSCSSSCSC